MQHAYQVFFQYNDEDEAMAKYSDVRNGGGGGEGADMHVE